MERTLTVPTAPAAHVLPERARLFTRLWPLWRHAAAFGVLLAIVGVGAMIRLDAVQLRKDLDRTSRAIVEARVLHDRLTMETESRRRILAMELTAARLGLGPTAKIEVLDARAVAP